MHVLVTFASRHGSTRAMAEAIAAELVFAGQACGPLTADVAGKLAAIEDGGGCRYYDKARAAERAGAAGVVIARAPGATLERGPEPVHIPAVLIAAYFVKSLPLTALRWLVFAVVLYAAVAMLRSARAGGASGEAPVTLP